MKIYNILPESASAPEKARKRYFYRGLIPAILLIFLALAYFLGPNSSWIRPLLFIALPGALIYFSYEFIILVKAMDELQRQIHTTAIAIAGGLICMAYTIAGILEISFGLFKFDSVFAYVALVSTYYLCLIVISVRYR